MTAVSNEMILQAITELSKITFTLSNDMVEVKKDIVEMKAEIVEMKEDIVDMKKEIVEMNGKIDRNQTKTDRIHNFYILQNEDMMEIRADVRDIKKAL